MVPRWANVHQESKFRIVPRLGQCSLNQKWMQFGAVQLKVSARRICSSRLFTTSQRSLHRPHPLLSCLCEASFWALGPPARPRRPHLLLRLPLLRLSLSCEVSSWGQVWPRDRSSFFCPSSPYRLCLRHLLPLPQTRVERRWTLHETARPRYGS